MDPKTFQSTITINNQQYNIKSSLLNSQLSLSLEHKHNLFCWQNRFSQTYIEDLTSKTGLKKTIHDFYETLQQSIQNPTEKSYVDVLTHQDLETMRDPLNVSERKPINNKRYIILSTSSENNSKIHYPLTLNAIDFDNPDILKSHLLNLKQEMEELKEKDSISNSKASLSSKGFFVTEKPQNNNGLIMDCNDKKTIDQNQSNYGFSLIDQLKNENELLKLRLKRIEQGQQQSKGAVELDNIVKTKYELEEELENFKKCSFNQVQKLQNTIDDKEDELVRNKTQYYQLQKNFAQNISQNCQFTANEGIQKLKDCVFKLTQDSENEIQNNKKQFQKQNKELEKYLQEIEILKTNDRKQKQRIKQLEIELEQSIKRISTKCTTDRLYSPYTKNNINSTSTRRSNSVPVKSAAQKTSTIKPKISRNISPSFQKKPAISTTEQQQFQKKKSPSPAVNRYSNGRSNFTNYNSPQTNFVNSGRTQRYMQPQQRQFGNNFTNQVNNKPKNVQSAKNINQTYNNGGSSNKLSNRQSISPGTKIKSLIVQNDQRLMKKIDEISLQKNKIQSVQIPKQYSDNHLSVGNLQTIQEIDNRLSKLQNILKMAKK